MASSPPPPPPFFTLPERGHMAGAALRLPSEQWAVEARRGEGDTVAHLLGGTGRVPAPLVAAMDEHIRQLAAAIDHDQQHLARRIRRATETDAPPALADFFPHDRVDEADEEALLANLEPAKVPMYREVARLAEEQLNLDARARRLSDGVQVTRPAPVPLLPRAYFDDFRRPALKGERKCRRGKNCVMRTGDLNKGFVGRAFFVGNTPPGPDAPPLDCIDCLLLEIEVMAQMNAKEDVVPLYSRQPFCVTVGRGEYASDDCIDINIDERPTGLVARIPRYTATRREYVPIPKLVLDFFLAQPEGRTKAMARGYSRVECDTGFPQASINAMDA